MKYSIHPEASEEHKQQITYYEHQQKGLGRRYHNDFHSALLRACSPLKTDRVIHPPDIRCVRFEVFQFNLIYRELDGAVQVLAVAHHKRQPNYWLGRL